MSGGDLCLIAAEKVLIPRRLQEKGARRVPLDFSGAIGGSRNSGLSRAAFDLGHMEMIQGDGQSPPNSFLLCLLTASMSKPFTSGRAKTFSAKA